MGKAVRNTHNRKTTLTNRKISWEFTFDRFGVRPETGDNESLKVDFARKAVRALGYWSQTVDSLYGDKNLTMSLMTNAGLLPQYPPWQSVAETVEYLQNWLIPQRQFGGANDYQGTVDGYASSQAIDEKIVEPRTQDFVEQIRLYLEAMNTWSQVFRAVTWVASLAGAGSTGTTAQKRLLAGLKSVIALYEFDATLDSTTVVKRFAGVLSSSLPSTRKGQDDATLEAQLTSFLKQGQNVLQYSESVPEFAPDPTLFYRWLQEFRESAQNFPHQSFVIPAPLWNAIEDRYWSQWKWPSIGAVSRVSPPESTPSSGLSGTRLDEVSALDLIYTTRYGSIPLLHWRGGNLSICQWSRILSIASLRNTVAFQLPRAAGLGNLGFDDVNLPAADSNLTGPIVMISPFSVRSPAWAWRPELGTRAFALMPPELMNNDEEVSPRDSKTTIENSLAVRASRIAQSEQHSTPLLHFIEVVSGERSENDSVYERLPWAPWKRVGFGLGPHEQLLSRYISGPRGLGELVALTRRNYPEVFPDPIDEFHTPIERFFYFFAKALRSAQYDVRRALAFVNGIFGVSRRLRHFMAYLREFRGT